MLSNSSVSDSEGASGRALEKRHTHSMITNSEVHPSADSRSVTTVDTEDSSSQGDASSRRRRSSGRAMFYGLAGLAGLMTMLAAAFVGVNYVLSENDFFIFIDDSYVTLVLLIQAVYWPLLTSSIFTTTTCMFLSGRILFRVGASLLLCLPAFAVFCFGLVYFLDADGEEIARDTFVVMFSGFLSIAAMVLLVQAVSSWVLTVEAETPMQRLGISGMIELTMVSACALALLMIWELPDYVESILIIVAICIPACLATLAIQVRVLGKAKRSRALMTISIACLYISVLVLNAYVAYYENGETISAITDLWRPILLLTAFGTVIVLAMAWLQLVWLRFCQWTCVNWRREDKRALGSVPTTTSPHPLDS